MQSFASRRRRLLTRPADLAARITLTLAVIAARNDADNDEKLIPSPAALQLYVLDDRSVLGDQHYVDDPVHDVESTMLALIQTSAWIGERPTEPNTMQIVAPNVATVITHMAVYELQALVPYAELTHVRMTQLTTQWRANSILNRTLMRSERNLAEWRSLFLATNEPGNITEIVAMVRAQIYEPLVLGEIRELQQHTTATEPTAPDFDMYMTPPTPQRK